MYNHLKFFFIIMLLSFQLIFSDDLNYLYKFEKVTFTEELPQVTVKSILQNKQGFMWIATSGGLAKYDGYRTKIYSYIPGNLNSLSSSNNINTIYEDSKGFIWIGLIGGGLDRFDPVSETFIHFKVQPNTPNTLSNNYVFAICEDRNGTIWTGNYLGGLNSLKLEPDKDKGLMVKFTNYFHNPQDPNSLSSDIVLAICPDQFGNIWMGTAFGLNKFDPKTKKFTRFFTNPKNSQSLSSNRISCVYEDSSRVIWIGTQDGGLNRLENKNKSKPNVIFTQFRADPHNPFSLSNDYIGCIFEDSKKNLWVGTVGGGLNKFDRKTEKFTSFRYDPFNKHSLSDNQVLSLYEDKTGNLWIGLGLGGINKLNLNSRNFVNFRLDTPENHNMSNAIFSLYEDKSNNLWSGNEYGYLCKFKLEKSKKSDDYIRKPISKEFFKISNSHIRAIHMDKEGTLWVGTLNEGVFQITSESLKTGNHINYRYSSLDPCSLNSDYVYTIHEDSLGNIWIGTGERGISILTPENREKRIFIHHQSNYNDIHSLSHPYVRKIYEDSKGIIWVGTNSGGLNKFDHENNSFIRYTYSNTDPTSISCNCVTTILEDSTGILWVGTGDAGLNKFDRKSGSFKRYTKKDGLPDNTIYGILEDKNKNLWLSTNKGLSRFNSVADIFVNFSDKDGIQDNEFNTGAYYKSSTTGQLYFGGINGITAFFPETIKRNTYIPPVQITSFTILNKEFSNNLVKNNSELNLSYKDYMFSFEFVALDFTDPKKNKFAYKLEGFNDDWIYTDWSRRIATFTNIPPGRYKFKVKGSNNHGIWNEKGISAIVVIKPPFWQTWWFKIFVIILFSLSILAIHKKRMQNLRIRLKTENEINQIYEKCKMTSREIEIINLLKKRKSYKEIEDELFISYHTVKNHVHNIFKKLGITNRAELIYYFKSIEDDIKRDEI